METSFDLSVIIPARNEERRIHASLAKLLFFLQRQNFTSEVIVSADSCTDRTVSLVQEVMQNNHFPIRLLYSSLFLGKGGAIRQAVKASLGKYVLFLDADLPVDLCSVNEALKLAPICDIVNGSRFLEGSSRTDPWFRRFLSRIYHTISRYMLGISYDTQCGFKLCNRNVAEDIFLGVITDGYSFSLEFMIQAQRRGYRIQELPVSWQFGRNTQFKMSSIWRMLMDMLVIKFRMMRSNSSRKGEHHEHSKFDIGEYDNFSDIT